MNEPVSRILGRSGLTAELVADLIGGAGYTLYIGGEQQSHVYTNDPVSLRFDYVQRIANLADLLDPPGPPGTPLRVLHLGAGALTLPRYLAQTRPGSTQWVIEYESDVVPFVTEVLPLPAGASVTVLVDDARAGLARVAAGAPFDLIVSDVYLGSNTPPHLTTVEFFASLSSLLAPEGVLAVNVADDPGLPLVRAGAATLAEVFEDVLVAGARGLTNDLDEGNAVLFASRGRSLAALQGALQARGPHPSGMIGADTLAAFIGDAEAVHDG
ncbi:spermidine synthase [Subtercola boreus]|uniref:SAM-dependent methyltransferase n=1 Tax=Subtercola boreus TaxID=120213 RepID=A0A3E0WB62_9MICO|nr:fused MFS/spermidine synthase [Subtercola boreus]RFA19467.1 hypothetical protein B7R24_12580 [Subtercola boreus]RFA19728.1 hypothetical protein B7R23_12560 [Subtercola boreus]RFA26094.1 hypothetical protein B7R25_12680 [Subtercola boreus]